MTLARRFVAGAIDVLLFTLVLLVALVAPDATSAPPSTASWTFHDDGSSEDSPLTIAAGDADATISVTNATDELQHFQISEANGVRARPAEGLPVLPGETAELHVGALKEHRFYYVSAFIDVDGDTFYAGPIAEIDAETRTSLDAASLGVTLALALVYALCVAVFGWPMLLLLLVAGTSGGEGGLSVVALGMVAFDVFLSIGCRRWWRGTPGERIVGIEVRTARPTMGLGPSLALRWLAKPLSGIPLLTGYWAPLLTDDRRTWHDQLGGVRFARRGEEDERTEAHRAVQVGPPSS